MVSSAVIAKNAIRQFASPLKLWGAREYIFLTGYCVASAMFFAMMQFGWWSICGIPVGLAVLIYRTSPIENPRLVLADYLIAQILPPALLFYCTFGKWGIPSGILNVLPLLVSLIYVPIHIYRKQNRLLLRPILTVIFCLIVIAMGDYYAKQSEDYLLQLANEMQLQCNRDGYCRPPAGEWRPSRYYRTLFESKTPGYVAFSISLTFNEKTQLCEPNTDWEILKSSPGINRTEEFRGYKTFSLTRHLEDQNYIVSGGVGCKLKF
jgi:hypothetical protein